VETISVYAHALERSHDKIRAVIGLMRRHVSRRGTPPAWRPGSCRRGPV